MGDRHWYTRKSKEDQTQHISKSIFVTNFPDHFSFHDLWRICDEYGKVIDVFMPNRKSKAGKRFAFVRYIKIENIERFVENLCELWVLIEFTSGVSKQIFSQHVGVGSWFITLNQVSKSFVVDERIVWVDVEGIPMHAWTQNTFSKIGSKWVEVLDMNDTDKNSLLQKMLCIKTTLKSIIFESFKVIVQGNVYWARAKEVYGWIPELRDDKYEANSSDEESLGEGSEGLMGENLNEQFKEQDTDVEEVSEISFMNGSTHMYSNEVKNCKGGKQTTQFEDPFKIYDILNKKQKTQVDTPDSHLKFPLGFTPLEEGEIMSQNKQDEVQFENESMVKEEPNVFVKENVTISDWFVVIMGVWVPTSTRLLIISVYAPQDLTEKQMLWDYLCHIIDRWDGESVILGDFDEVRTEAERFSSTLKPQIILDTRFPKMLTVDQVDELERHFSVEEIKKALWDCGSHKSPGPDGFTFEFFQRYWSFIAADVLMQWNVFLTGYFPRGSMREIDQAASFVGCSTFKTPFSYLGVIVGGSMSRIHTWDDVTNKISSPLSKWKLKTLSIGGRLTLLKSVLGSFPLYHMSIFKVPMGVLKKMEAICRNFFIGAEAQDRKMMWWVWRFITRSSSMWSRVIKAIHGKSGLLDRNMLMSKRKKVGNGEDTLFWEELWIGDKALKFQYARLMPRGRDEYEQHSDLSSRINELELAQIQDRWYWSLVGTCIFSVKSVRNFIDDFMLVSDEIWRFRNNLLFGLTAPKKATIFDDIVTLAYTWCSNRYSVVKNKLVRYCLVKLEELEMAVKININGS
uniref:RNA-directed DNA polymerase, eukaryota, reverse transcriptase zinc-binding domain protein n=1 Tax=Tanacetum cinerariifolium TaxID=118510 RepID=A0A6L2K6M9_TANCI|nr:RNA-directed DNA polymerase, eukaryota, reverse transcriptase zinc-binding domain protein [Tanacetum cinerariifolium]